MNDLERVIDCSLRFETGIKNLNILYEKIEKVIDQEHKYIGESDFSSLEKILPDKESLGGEITKWSEDLMEVGRIVSKILSDEKYQRSHMIGLSECLNIMKSLNIGEPSSFHSKILSHLLVKIERQLEGLFGTLETVRPKIEQNRYILTKLLFRQREYLRNWAETMSDTRYTYGKEGDASSMTQYSVIEVKA